MKTKARKDGREEVLDGTLDLPPDVYNGMVLLVAKTSPRGQFGSCIELTAEGFASPGRVRTRA